MAILDASFAAGGCFQWPEQRLFYGRDRSQTAVPLVMTNIAMENGP